MRHVVLYTPIFGLHKTLSDLSFTPRGEDVFFFYSETLISFRRHISELMVPGFCTPKQLLMAKVNRAQWLAIYLRDGFSVYRQRSYECGCRKFIVVRIYISSHNFYVFGVYLNPDLSDKVFDC